MGRRIGSAALVPATLVMLAFGAVAISASGLFGERLDVEAVAGSPEHYWETIAAAVRTAPPMAMFVATEDRALSPRRGSTLADLLPADVHERVVLVDDQGAHLLASMDSAAAAKTYGTSLAIFSEDFVVRLPSYLSVNEIRLLMDMLESRETVDELREAALRSLSAALSHPKETVSCDDGRRKIFFKSICTTCPSYTALRDELENRLARPDSNCSAVLYLPNTYEDAVPTGLSTEYVHIRYYDVMDPSVHKAMTMLSLIGETFPLRWQS